MVKKRLLLLLIFSFVLIGCAVKEVTETVPEVSKKEAQKLEERTTEETIETTEAPAGWEVYRNKQYRFEIKYPPGLVMNEGFSGNVIAFAPPEAPVSAYRNNMHIYVETSPSLTLDDYMNIIIENGENLITDFKIVSSSDTTLAGLPARKLVYTGSKSQWRFQWLEVVTKKNGDFYQITYFAEISEYSDFFDTVTKMINSFTLL